MAVQKILKIPFLRNKFNSSQFYSFEIVAVFVKSFFADINYFHCVRIVEILKDTEKDTKNFLGYYSSQRMNDWMVC